MNQIYIYAADRNALAGCYHQSKFCIPLWHVGSLIVSHAEVYYYYILILTIFSILAEGSKIVVLWNVVLYLTVQPHIQEDHSLNVRHNENLVSHVEIIV